MSDAISRRDVLRRSLTLAVVAVGAQTLGGCKSAPKEVHCDDTTGMPPGDIELRKAVAYVDMSGEPGKSCDNCAQFVAPPNATSCGSCKVVKGPIHPKGYCKTWVAKTA